MPLLRPTVESGYHSRLKRLIDTSTVPTNLSLRPSNWSQPSQFDHRIFEVLEEGRQVLCIGLYQFTRLLISGHEILIGWKQTLPRK